MSEYGVKVVMDKYSKNGFTLIEVLIAITVFSIGILAVISMQTASVGSNARAVQITKGVTVAADRVETILSLPYNDANLNAAGSPHTATAQDFTLSWTVTDNSPIIGVKKIAISVTNTVGVTTATKMLYFKEQEF